MFKEFWVTYLLISGTCPKPMLFYTLDEGTKTLIFRVGDLTVMQKRCLRTHGSWGVWHLLHTYQRHEQTPSQSLFLLSRGVHTSSFSRTLKDITELLEVETRIFLRYPPKPCGPNPFWLNSWLSWSFHKHTWTFPPYLSSFLTENLTCLNSSWVHFDLLHRNVHQIWRND